VRIGKWGANSGALVTLDRKKGVSSRPYNVFVIWIEAGVNKKVV